MPPVARSHRGCSRVSSDAWKLQVAHQGDLGTRIEDRSVRRYTRTVEARPVTFLAVVAVASAAAVVPVVVLAASVCWPSTASRFSSSSM
jgi:Mn2+/Fe2+ NRAMP family transporter